jgi:photosystem II stability/assembly factor-like uncharacterized protein
LNAPALLEIEAEVTDMNTCISTLPAQWVHAGWQLPVEEPLHSSASRDLLAIHYANNNVACIAASDGSVLTTQDGGLSWQEANAGLIPAKPVYDVSHYQNKFYACSQNGIILSSLNNGLTWQRVQLNTGETFSSISFSANGIGYVCGTNGIIRRFNGNIWQSAPSGTLQHLNDIVSIGSGFLAVGNNGTIRRFANNSLDTLDAGTALHLNSIFMLNADTGFVCGDNGLILKTMDGGNVWNTLLLGSQSSLKSIGLAGDTLWAAGSMGRVLISIDAGNTWLERKVFPKEDINALAYNASLQKVFLAGSNNFIRMFGDPDAVPDTVSAIRTSIPSVSWRLFPNPANDWITITGLNDANGFRTLSWFDQRGQKVVTQEISNATMNGTLSLSVKNFSNGMYFLRLEGEEEALTFKVVIHR